MSYILKISVLLVLVQLTVSGCSQDMASKNFDINLQLTPDKPSERIVENERVSYILPTSMIANKNIEDVLQFRGFHNGRESKQEKLCISHNKNMLRVERRTDNGVAGSGVVYDIEIMQKVIGSVTQVTYEIKKENKYQEGLVLPFAVPNFDIKTFLSMATTFYKIEFSSVYNVDSIKANFDRLLNQRGNNQYYWETGLANYDISIKFYPYRNGTKVVTNSSIKTHPQKGDIDVNRAMNELKAKLEEVLNS